MRTLRTDAPDSIWHVTSRVNWRAWHLKAANAYSVFLAQLARALAEFSVDLLAYVIMSNHFHMVLRCPTEEIYRRLTGRKTRCRHFRAWPPTHPKSTVVGQCIGGLKRNVAVTLQDGMGLSGHFWQGRHHRRRLVDPWAIVVAVAYDHRNPVRAGMVSRPEQYDRSSAAWWATGEPTPVPLATRPDFPFGMQREEFRGMLLRLQADKRLDDVMHVFAKSRLPIDSPKGRAYLETLMAEAGLDPLKCGTRAPLPGA